MSYKFNSRRWFSLVLVAFLMTIALPLVTYASVAAQANGNGTQPTAAQLTPANCLHAGTCSYACPGGTTAVNSLPQLCCPTNTTYNTSSKLCEQSATTTGANGGSGTTSSTNTQSPQLACTVSIFNPLTWLICPLVSAAQGAIEGLTSGIDSLLTVNTNTLFGSTSTKGSTSAGFYQAWNTFRIFGVGLIVIAGLIMLIAQAAGSDVIDAYTIHKVLPRILIAVVGISLSWWLLSFAITFTNDVGTGIRAIIYTPFESLGTTVTLKGGAATVGAIVGTATFLTLGLLGIATFMLTALLAVFVGFLILFLRQVVIMMLVIFAPLAIACYVLPGTQKAWGFWKDTFLSMLIVFPIISAMIAMGRVFAVVMDNTTTNGVPSFVNQIGAFVMYFLPYFLLPAAFRFAGGAMATIGGFVNDRHRGAFDRLKGVRKNRAAANMTAMKHGNRFKADNFMAAGFNRTTRGIANAPSAGFNPRKMRSRFQAGSSLAEESEMKEYMESAAFSTYRNNDDYLQATMKNMGGGNTEADWRNYLERQGYTGQALEQGVATIRNARRGSSLETFKKASVIANASTGTGWKEGSASQMMESINEAYEGDRHGATNALAQMRSAASQSGRLDLAGMSFGQQAKALNDMEEEREARGGEVSAATKQRVNQTLSESVLQTKGANDFARARGQAVEHLSVQMREDLQRQHTKVDTLKATATRTGSVDDVSAANKAERVLVQKYASLANFHDSLNHMSPENARYIADNVLSQPIHGGVTGMDRINQYTADGGDNGRAYRDTRKDYGVRENAQRQGEIPEDPNA
jgi:hypothetical protein